MKVEINKEGVMIITPETWKEDEQLTDKEYKKLMKALYPKYRSKKFRR